MNPKLDVPISNVVGIAREIFMGKSRDQILSSFVANSANLQEAITSNMFNLVISAGVNGPDAVSQTDETKPSEIKWVGIAIYRDGRGSYRKHSGTHIFYRPTQNNLQTLIDSGENVILNGHIQGKLHYSLSYEFCEPLVISRYQQMVDKITGKVLTKNGTPIKNKDSLSINITTMSQLPSLKVHFISEDFKDVEHLIGPKLLKLLKNSPRAADFSNTIAPKPNFIPKKD